MNYLEDLLRAGESEQLDFKAGAESLDNIGADVCAFLNSQGGILVVGVDDRGGWLRHEGEGPATVYVRTEVAYP
jgi:predicted HTH transcriptional regulator